MTQYTQVSLEPRHLYPTNRQLDAKLRYVKRQVDYGEGPTRKYYVYFHVLMDEA